MSVEVLLKNAAKTIGEGPYWDQASKSLYYVDILSSDVHRWNSVTGVDEAVHCTGYASFVVPSVNGDLIISEKDKISRLDFDSKKLTVLHQTEGRGSAGCRFNDGKCDAAGRLWAGTMGIESGPAVLENGCGSLYRMDADPTVLHTIEPVVDLSNGLSWTGDNSKMFYIDSIPRQVYCYSFDASEGTISNRQVAVDFSKTAMDDLGYPDGMAIDAEDKIWIACYGASKVVRFDPETGQRLRTINIPTRQTTSCCFGGDDWQDLYVTSAAMKSSAAATTDELAGSVFKVTGLGVKGCANVPYAG